jgi:peroxiredoxin
MSQVKAAEATPVAVSPRIPYNSQSTAEKSELAFEMTSDLELCRSLGLWVVFDMPDELVVFYITTGHDLSSINGNRTGYSPF